MNFPQQKRRVGFGTFTEDGDLFFDTADSEFVELCKTFGNVEELGTNSFYLSIWKTYDMLEVYAYLKTFEEM